MNLAEDAIEIMRADESYPCLGAAVPSLPNEFRMLGHVWFSLVVWGARRLWTDDTILISCRLYNSNRFGMPAA